MIVVARGLGQTDYGYFTFALSFAILFVGFGRWGLNPIVVREISRKPEQVSVIFASSFVLRLILALIGLLLAVAMSPLFVESTTAVLAVVLVGSALLVDEMSSLLGAVFQSFERMKYQALAVLANRVLSALVASVALVLGAGLLSVCAAYLAGSLTGLLYAWLMLKRHFPETRLGDYQFSVARRLGGLGLPLGLAGFLALALFRVDSVMLEAMEGPAEVALYGVAYRFFEPILFVGHNLADALLPSLSRAGGRSEQAVQAMTALNVAFYLPIAIGAPFVAPWAVTALFGSRYSEAAEAVVWVAGAALFYSLGYLAKMVLTAAGERRLLAYVGAATLVFNVSLNIALIPALGFVGAGIATFFAQAVELALLGIVLAKVAEPMRPTRLILIPILATTVMGLFLWMLELRDGAAVLAGGGIYLIMMLTLGRVIGPRELRGIWQMIRSREAGAVAATASARMEDHVA